MHEWQTAAFDTQKRLLGVRWLFGVSGDHPDAPADPPQKDSWVSNGFSEGLGVTRMLPPTPQKRQLGVKWLFRNLGVKQRSKPYMANQHWNPNGPN